jgi:hypothetical protein
MTVSSLDTLTPKRTTFDKYGTEYQYFEIELRKVENKKNENELAQITIKNISTIIKNQQKLSDKIY